MISVRNPTSCPAYLQTEHAPSARPRERFSDRTSKTLNRTTPSTSLRFGVAVLLPATLRGPSGCRRAALFTNTLHACLYNSCLPRPLTGGEQATVPFYSGGYPYRYSAHCGVVAHDYGSDTTGCQPAHGLLQRTFCRTGLDWLHTGLRLAWRRHPPMPFPDFRHTYPSDSGQF